MPAPPSDQEQRSLQSTSSVPDDIEIPKLHKNMSSTALSSSSATQDDIEMPMRKNCSSTASSSSATQDDIVIRMHQNCSLTDSSSYATPDDVVIGMDENCSLTVSSSSVTLDDMKKQGMDHNNSSTVTASSSSSATQDDIEMPMRKNCSSSLSATPDDIVIGMHQNCSLTASILSSAIYDDEEMQRADQHNSSTLDVPPSTNGDLSCCGGLGSLRKKFFSITPIPVDDMSVNYFDIAILVFSLMTFVGDIGTDIRMAVEHHQNGDIWWMALTITFIFTPSVYGFILGVYAIVDMGKSGWEAVRTMAYYSIPGVQIYWYIEAIRDAFKSRNGYDADKFVSSMRLSANNGLREALVEATPQLVLQLYVVLRDPNKTVAPIQWASICSSLLALSWGITSHYKANYMDNRKVKISYPAVALVFGWHLFTVWARVLALAICAVYLVYVLIGILAPHFIISFIFLFLIDLPQRSEINLARFAFAFLLSFMTLISSYVSDHLLYSRLQFSFLHTLIYIENVCMLMLWYFSPVSHDAHLWFRYLALVSIIGGYLIGVLCQIAYYVKLHPRNFQKEKEMHIAICMPWKDWIYPRERRKRIDEKLELRKWKEEIRRGREGARNEEDNREQEEEVERKEQVFERHYRFKQQKEAEEWKKEIATEEGRIVRRWIDEIRRWGEGERTEEELRRHEGELQRQENIMGGYVHCPEEEKAEWKKEISTAEGRIVRRWIEEIRGWGEGPRTEEENRRHEEELRGQEDIVRWFFVHCPEEEKKEWEKEISTAEGRIVSRWIEEIRGWREGSRSEEGNREHEEEIKRQENVMRWFFFFCPKEKKEWKKEVSTAEGRIVTGWIEEIRGWGEGPRTEEENRRNEEELQRQEDIVRWFFHCPEEEKEEWEKEISTEEGRIARGWTEELRQWREGQKTEEENREHEEELQEQIKLMRGFFHCPEEEKEEWKEEIKTEEKRIVSRWTEEIRQWRDGEETEDVIREQKVEIQRQEQLFWEFYLNYKKEDKIWKEEISRWKKEMKGRKKDKK